MSQEPYLVWALVEDSTIRSKQTSDQLDSVVRNNTIFNYIRQDSVIPFLCFLPRLHEHMLSLYVNALGTFKISRNLAQDYNDVCYASYFTVEAHIYSLQNLVSHGFRYNYSDAFQR